MAVDDLQPKIELYRSPEEEAVRAELVELFRECPVPDAEILANLGLFLSSKHLSRILLMHHLYSQIVDTQGVIMEFGSRWGNNLGLFAALRGIYEPFNRHRKIVGFDTFEGFPGISEKDLQDHPQIRRGGFAVTKGYERYLERLLGVMERDHPISHIRKFEVRKGDAGTEVHRYLEENPETIVALAYFDLDIYEPTKQCIEAIRPRLFRGSVLAFDELNDHDCPGETLALMETFGLNAVKLRKYPHAARVSYFVVD
jgi:hypothetical protein